MESSRLRSLCAGTVCWMLAVLCAALPCRSQAITEVVYNNSTAYAHLTNGQIVALMAFDDVQQQAAQWMVPDAVSTDIRLFGTPPPSADLREDQTEIRTQVGGTCWDYAVVAAIEAAYRRMLGVKLDLSERFANLVYYDSRLCRNLEPAAACRETAPAAAIGGVSWQLMRVLTRYCLPLEQYSNWDGYSPPPFRFSVDPEARDSTACSSDAGQRATDDYNLPLFTNMALRNAVYGIEPNGYVVATQSDLTDPGWIERALAAGHEVEIGFHWETYHRDATPENNTWDVPTEAYPPGNIIELPPAHAVLVVGYDHESRVFTVKNSWGVPGTPYLDKNGKMQYTNSEDGYFVRMSYDWVTNGNVTEMAYITQVRPPSAAPVPEMTVLGRWNLDFDGWRGTLDIYRQSHFYDESEIHGVTDRRVGTLWDAEGNGIRVNGAIAGDQLVFWFSGQDSNCDYDEPFFSMPGGSYFRAIVSCGSERSVLAGVFHDSRDSTDYGFYATKEAYLTGSGVSGAPRPDSYLGAWTMYHGGTEGVLVLSGYEVDPAGSTARFTGSYVRLGSSLPTPATADVSLANPRAITLNLQVSSSAVLRYQGYMYSWETGVMSGTEIGDPDEGFVAVRERE